MELRVTINVNRRTGFYLTTFGFIALAGIWGATAYAGAVSVPNTFSSGQVISSSQMNENFQALVTAINSINNGSVPAGTVIAYAGNVIPPGWLLCDGSAVNRTEYANLFAAITISHGGGDGVNTFNLPDYRGRFLRGVDANSGHDPDSAARVALQATNTAGPGNVGDQVGSYQSSAFASHDHPLTDPGHGHTLHDPGHSHAGNAGVILEQGAYGADCAGGFGGGGLFGPNVCGAGTTAVGTGITLSNATTGITMASAGTSTETRPANVYVQFIIKT